MYDRIIVPLDGSVVAEQVLPHVQALARQFSSVVILLRATTPPEEVTPLAAAGPALVAGPQLDTAALVEAEAHAASVYLEATAESLRSAGVRVECAQQDGPAAYVILEQARKRGADLIAMTTHGRGGLVRLALGSVADGVVRGAPCPVLLVRATEVPLQQP
jgi:nucleotide-binding universal stress UspA family protein